jgi:hemolysin III
MIQDLPEEYVVEHYPNAMERGADFWLHVGAIAAACCASFWIAWITLRSGSASLAAAALVYGFCLTAMLAFSAVYNLSRVSPARPLLRKLDEAGIFLMIAGSYTPFTTQRLHGVWAVGMTTAVWSIAAAGIVGKFAFPHMLERAWTLVYVLFGWLAVMAFRPLAAGLPHMALVLLIAGGVVYTIGSLIFLNRNLPFRRAIWHGFVCTAATLHFMAVVIGVLTPLEA